MIGSKKYKLTNDGKNLYSILESKINQIKYKHLPNPCGEVSLNAKGGYCVIGDLMPYFCETLDEVKQAGRLAARFLIRCNLMDSIYKDETKRTNRIGVSLTGIHEFAWKFFGYNFYDLINESKSQNFWNFIKELRLHIMNEATKYSKELGVNTPHTFTAIKPSGSVSKLYNLTEGIHLPAMKFYIRWVQFQNNDPRLGEYRSKGYPVKELKSYPNVSIVGFPTQPLISRIMPLDKIVTASEASPEDQYKYLMLFEKYYLGDGENNQLSYTLKVNPNKVSYNEFKKTLIEYQSKIRCCSVLIDTDNSLYEYVPEQQVTEKEFLTIFYKINDPEMIQEINLDTLMCQGASCPL